MIRLTRAYCLVLATLLALGCNNADKHHWNWNNGFDREFSFSYIDVDITRGGYPEQIDADDFFGAGLESYSVADEPGVFYRSLGISEDTAITLVLFPPGQASGVPVATSRADATAGVFSSAYGSTTQIQMFWLDTINWAAMAQRYGYGTYKVCWYWDDEKKQPAAQHTFDLTP